MTKKCIDLTKKDWIANEQKKFWGIQRNFSKKMSGEWNNEYVNVYLIKKNGKWDRVTFQFNVVVKILCPTFDGMINGI